MFVYMNTQVNTTAAAVSKSCDCTLTVCLLSASRLLSAIKRFSVITHDVTYCKPPVLFHHLVTRRSFTVDLTVRNVLRATTGPHLTATFSRESSSPELTPPKTIETNHSAFNALANINVSLSLAAVFLGGSAVAPPPSAGLAGFHGITAQLAEL